MLGGLIGGKLVNRLGRKPLAIITALIAGIFSVFFTLLQMCLFQLPCGLVVLALFL